MGDLKYPALGTIGGVYRFLGAVTVIVTLFVIVAGLVQVFVNQEYFAEGFFGFIGALLGATWGSIVVLVIYGGIGAIIATLQIAVSEVIVVIVDIERNTRL